MNRNTLIFIFFLLFLTIGLGYVRLHAKEIQQALKSSTATTPIQLSPTPSPITQTTATASATLAQANDAQIEKLLTTLTPRQKIAQLLAISIDLTPPPAPVQISTATASGNTTPNIPIQQFVTQEDPGFITLFGGNISRAKATQLITDLKSSASTASGITPFFAVDHEGGTVQRLSGAGFTKLPSWQTLCATQSATLISQSAAELHATGINVIFGPVLDVASPSSFLRSRACASDPEIITQQSIQWATIFQQNGIRSVLKHYPGIGDAQKDPHQQFQTIQIQPDQEQVFLDVVHQIPSASIMIAHVGIQGTGTQDSANQTAGSATNPTSQTPCSLSSACVESLRAKTPQTLFFTDALEMKALGLNGKQPDLAVAAQNALLAGEDVLVFGPDISSAEMDRVERALVNEYANSPQFQNRVDQSLRRVLEYKSRPL